MWLVWPPDAPPWQRVLRLQRNSLPVGLWPKAISRWWLSWAHLKSMRKSNWITSPSRDENNFKNWSHHLDIHIDIIFYWYLCGGITLAYFKGNTLVKALHQSVHFWFCKTRLLTFQHTPEKKKTPELSFCTGHAKRILRIQSATVDLQCGCILLAPHHVG